MDDLVVMTLLSAFDSRTVQEGSRLLCTPPTIASDSSRLWQNLRGYVRGYTLREITQWRDP